jgi:hypothetical protein
MRRIILALMLALVMAAMMLATAMRAFADVKCTGESTTVCSGRRRWRRRSHRRRLAVR